jgi:hypothetical protein
VAGFLHGLRVEGRAVPVSAAEAICLVASGIDNLKDLSHAMGLDPAACNRLVSFLRGRARFSAGKWIEGGPALIDVRRHPHRRGLQLRLSAAGVEALRPLSTSVRARTDFPGSRAP